MTFKQSGLLFLLILSIGLPACDQPTEPKDTPGPDTTSHNFVWRVDTLGGPFSTAISIEIVNENEIYVGGEFFVYPDPTDLSVSDRFNLAVWDGNKWTLKKILFVGYNNAPPYLSPIKIIKHFENGHILLVSSYNSFAKFDGKNWTSFYPGTGTDKQYCWARSETDVYFAGDGGGFTHYDGSTFKVIPTGVTNHFIDIWGDDKNVWITSDDQSTPAFAFGEFNGIQFRLIDFNPKEGENRSPFGYRSVYKSKSNNSIFVMAVGALLEVTSTNPYLYKTIYNTRESGYVFYWIRGNASNDLYLGDWNTQSFSHFNGKTWKTFTTNGEGQEAFTVKGNLIAGCGNASNINPPRVYVARHF
ncbi:MAG: hypothetical protein J0L62_06615 [Bacteroidetes bacterium]|nr:hypothetical protein [Bacteroidota bacterium]